MAVFKKRGRWWVGYRGADGIWHREPVPDIKIDGKPCPATKEDAKKIETKRKESVEGGTWVPTRIANSKTFNEVVDQFWELHGRNRPSHSWPHMIERVRAALGARKIGAITVADVQTFVNDVRERTSISTANRYRTLLSSIFSKARKYRLFHGDNPVHWVEKGKEPKYRLRYFSLEEMDRLLKAVDTRTYPVVATALLTGMRRREILELTWENVNLERCIIYVLKSKSGQSREVPVPGKLHEVLMSLGPRSSGPIFGVTIAILRKDFDKALKTAGIPTCGPDKAVFHTCRHTFGSWFIMRGGSIYTLQKLLGHSTIAMTEKYAHLGRGHIQTEIALFESAIPVKGLPLQQNSTKIAPQAPTIASQSQN